MKSSWQPIPPVSLAALALATILAGCSNGGKKGISPPPASIQFSAATYIGGESGGAVTVTVTRTASPTGAIAVDFAAVAGSATAGIDFVATSGTLSWVDQDTADKTFTVDIIDDTLIEGDETVSLTLSGPAGRAILGAPATASLTIIDDDSPPAGTLELGAALYTVCEAAGIISIAVTRTGGSAGAVSVSFATSDGTATSPDDYDSAASTLSWPDGDAGSKAFAVVINDDSIVEGDETVNVTLSGPMGGATFGAVSSAVITIQDDDTGPSGALVPAFGSGGVVTVDPSAGTDIANSIAIDTTFMYVAGYDEAAGIDDLQWRIEKRSLADGSLDPTFGTGGVVTNNPSPFKDRIRGIAIDAAFLYLVGEDESAGSSDPQWRIEKRGLADGSLDAGFGTAGVITNNPSGGRLEWASAIAIDAGSMYVVGNDESPGPVDWQWRIEKRSLADGSLAGAFGTAGVVLSDPSGADDLPQGITLDATSLYVVGNDANPGVSDSQWRIEKRGQIDGLLDAGFGNGGVIQDNPSGSFDGATSVAIDSTFLYIAGHDDTPGAGDSQWRIEKRRPSVGALDITFGLGGVVTDDHSGGFDSPNALALDSSSIYVVGFLGTAGFADPQWVIQKRALADGSPDPIFGTGGIVTSNPSPDGDYATALAMDASFLYVVGYDESPGPGDWQWRIEKRNK